MGTLEPRRHGAALRAGPVKPSGKGKRPQARVQEGQPSPPTALGHPKRRWRGGLNSPSGLRTETGLAEDAASLPQGQRCQCPPPLLAAASLQEQGQIKGSAAWKEGSSSALAPLLLPRPQSALAWPREAAEEEKLTAKAVSCPSGSDGTCHPLPEVPENRH